MHAIQTRWSLMVAALALAACGTNPVTGKRELQLVTGEQEVAIGEEQYLAAQQMQGGELVTDAKLAQYYMEIGRASCRERV